MTLHNYLWCHNDSSQVWQASREAETQSTDHSQANSDNLYHKMIEVLLLCKYNLKYFQKFAVLPWSNVGSCWCSERSHRGRRATSLYELEQALQLAEWWIFFYWDEPEWALTLAIGWQIFYMYTYFVSYIFLHVLNTIAVLIPSIYLTLYPGNVPSHRKGKHRIACILHHWTKIQRAAVSLSHDDDGLQTIINNDKSLSKQSKHVPTLMCVSTSLLKLTRWISKNLTSFTYLFKYPNHLLFTNSSIEGIS